MVTVSIVCFILTAVMLWYVVRFRVHIHITHTPAAPRNARARRAAAPQTAPPPDPALFARTETSTEAETIQTITSALVNLGADRKTARKAAARAAGPGISEGVAFNEILRRAIQFSREAA